MNRDDASKGENQPIPTEVIRSNSNMLLALHNGQESVRTQTHRQIYNLYSEQDIHAIFITDKSMTETKEWCEKIFATGPSKVDLITTDVRSDTQTGFSNGSSVIVEPNDPAEVGLEANKMIRSSEENKLIIVYFQLLNKIINERGTEVAFRFLHLLSTRIKKEGGKGYYQANPRKMDVSQLNKIMGAADVAATYDGNHWHLDVED